MTILVGPGRTMLVQAEGSRFDYVLDLTRILEGDTITTLSHTAVGCTVEDMRVLTAPIDADGTTLAVGSAVGFWLSGGTKILPARLRLTVTSSSGRVIPLSWLVLST